MHHGNALFHINAKFSSSSAIAKLCELVIRRCEGD
jgi:hypothetical protein